LQNNQNPTARIDVAGIAPGQRTGRSMKKTIALLLVAALLALAGAAAFVRLGLYDISATTAHTSFVYRLLETTMRHSVGRRAAAIEAPALRDPARLALGAACYRIHCVQCHGGPGVAQGAVGKSMQPLPGPLVDAARRWTPKEVYWITRHGIKMSGMPAWELRLTDAELWAVTAFVDQLAELSPAAYASQGASSVSTCGAAEAEGCSGPACARAPSADLESGPGRGRDEHAKLALVQHACSACHRIPGIVGPDTHVGPPLDELARRQVLVGGLAPTADNLVRWIRDPRGVDPGTAMPDMGVSEAHARLMADYLLKPR
jgi:mono/diheme cytochrome c family protein